MTPETSDLKVTVEEPRSWARRLTITVPADRVERERREVVRRLAQRLKLPGFRQGRIPPQVLERKYGPAIEQEAVERVVGDAYKEALQNGGFQPITQGAVDNVDYRPDAGLTFDVEFEVRPEIELPRLSGFEVRREPVEVEDAEVDRVLNRLREEQAVWRDPEEAGPPANGDMVSVEVTPLRDEAGETAPEPRPYRFVLGEQQALPEVEEAIRSLEPGAEIEIEIAPPEPDEPGATEEAGPQRVRIGLKEVKRPDLPALDDEFARSLGDFEDIETLRARIHEDLVREAEAEAERSVRRQLLDQILDANPFEVPQSLVDEYLDRVMRPRDDFDPEQVARMREEARPAAEQALKRMLVIERVAELHGLRATEAEVDARVEEIAGRSGRPVGEVWAQLQKSGRIGSIEEEITERKVFEYLLSQSDAK